MFPFIFPVSFLPPSICFTPGTPPHCLCSAYPNRRKENWCPIRSSHHFGVYFLETHSRTYFKLGSEGGKTICEMAWMKFPFFSIGNSILQIDLSIFPIVPHIFPYKSLLILWNSLHSRNWHQGIHPTIVQPMVGDQLESWKHPMVINDHEPLIREPWDSKSTKPNHLLSVGWIMFYFILKKFLVCTT